VLLENLFADLQAKRVARHERLLKQHENLMRFRRGNDNTPPLLQSIKSIDCPISVNKYAKEKQLDKASFMFDIANLVSLGILQWHTDVSVEAEKSDTEPENKDVEVNVYVSNNSEFVFTAVGEKFMEVTIS